MHILVVEALLIATYSTGDEQILMHKRKPCRSRTCLVRIAGPCPAVPFQLVPAQLGLSPAGPYQLWCTTLRIATETRPTRNKLDRDRHSWTGTSYSDETGSRPTRFSYVYKYLLVPSRIDSNKQCFHNQYMHTCLLRATRSTWTEGLEAWKTRGRMTAFNRPWFTAQLAIH